jgi:hypothetical protein
VTAARDWYKYRLPDFYADDNGPYEAKPKKSVHMVRALASFLPVPIELGANNYSYLEKVIICWLTNSSAMRHAVEPCADFLYTLCTIDDLIDNPESSYFPPHFVTTNFTKSILTFI